MSDPVVRLATVRDRRRILDLVAEAFRKDLAFRFFFPDDETYADLVDRFAGHLLDRRLATASAWVVDDGTAVALWDPPVDATAEASPSEDGPSGPDLPADVQARIDLWDATVHHLLPAEPHWYLGVLASDPAHAGRGLGRAAMAAGLARARSEGRPACLETATPTNVDLYRRSGWDVVGTAEVGDIRTWVMLHPAGTTA